LSKPQNLPERREACICFVLQFVLRGWAWDLPECMVFMESPNMIKVLGCKAFGFAIGSA
jgi:hypothetical protein